METLAEAEKWPWYSLLYDCTQGFELGKTFNGWINSQIYTVTPVAIVSASNSHGYQLSWSSFSLKLKNWAMWHFPEWFTNNVAPWPSFISDASTVRINWSDFLEIVNVWGFLSGWGRIEMMEQSSIPNDILRNLEALDGIFQGWQQGHVLWYASWDSFEWTNVWSHWWAGFR